KRWCRRGGESCQSQHRSPTDFAGGARVRGFIARRVHTLPGLSLHLPDARGYSGSAERAEKMPASGFRATSTPRPYSRVPMRLCIAVSCVSFAFALGVAPVAAQQIPLAPAPVAVQLDSGSTALLVLDITTQTCSSQPNCLEFVPRVASLLANARAAGVYV